MPKPALFAIVVFVTNCEVGTPKMRMAASGLGGGMPGMGQEADPVTLTPPAYSIRALSITSAGAGASLNQRPSQSPAAGDAASDVKTIGLAAVPAAMSVETPGAAPVARSMYITPPFLKRTVTPGSIVRVVSPVLPPTYSVPAAAG